MPLANTSHTPSAIWVRVLFSGGLLSTTVEENVSPPTAVRRYVYLEPLS